ncbi:MAG TPA: phosphatase PAP2 family protein [Ramlibacter sp.]|jgi:membrane-associated PAP2 superfamily phosphatase|uniref:phosphatase PAP2 family protein n=1 Tax=Ramlibacter sp. TaxID=1917967 RepID=UPI002D32A8E3|nr:phosphatase PAP2 family protein [Ramlibacter sp.]HZY19421.1 phosphatase PAP2 family protein [Ramlibacter sp.]
MTAVLTVVRPRSAWASVLLGLVLVAAWDASGLDLPLARLAGDLHGFPLRDHWLFTTVLHAGGKAVAWAVLTWLLLGIRWPSGVLLSLPVVRRVWLAAATLGAMLLVTLLKHGSTSSCPWDMVEFGGLAHWGPHWFWWRHDGGPGQCFPAGHASAGFAWVAGYFAFRDLRPGLARAWLAIALTAGTLLALGQQVRGAHFASHSLWTAWLCWAWAWACSGWLRPGAVVRLA